MSVRYEKGRGWNVSLCVVERRDVVSHWEGITMLGLTGHYLHVEEAFTFQSSRHTGE